MVFAPRYLHFFVSSHIIFNIISNAISFII